MEEEVERERAEVDECGEEAPVLYVEKGSLTRSADNFFFLVC